MEGNAKSVKKLERYMSPRFSRIVSSPRTPQFRLSDLNMCGGSSCKKLLVGEEMLPYFKNRCGHTKVLILVVLNKKIQPQHILF